LLHRHRRIQEAIFPDQTFDNLNVGIADKMNFPGKHETQCLPLTAMLLQLDLHRLGAVVLLKRGLIRIAAFWFIIAMTTA
jgi:hypothetical protein